MYLSLNDDIIPDHGYVVVSDIGLTDSTTLFCHTNRPPPAGSDHSEGNWYAPGVDRVNFDDVPGFTRDRGTIEVRLKRTTRNPTQGIYHCSVMDADGNDKIVLDYTMMEKV